MALGEGLWGLAGAPVEVEDDELSTADLNILAGFSLPWTNVRFHPCTVKRAHYHMVVELKGRRPRLRIAVRRCRGHCDCQEQ